MKFLKKKKLKKIDKFLKCLKGDSKLFLDKNQIVKQKQVTELNWDGE
jgi:hypothetical protein